MLHEPPPCKPDESPSAVPERRSPLSTWILLGLLAGIACGVLFGEYCAWLKLFGDVFVGLLQMTVLPYIVVSLIANFGRLSLGQSRRLAWVGGWVLVGLWGVGLFTVAVVPQSFPAWKAGAFFSTVLTEPPPQVDFLALFIPANVFASLANSMVPAVVVFCICLGLALVGCEERQALIAHLDTLAQALARINGFITRLTPYGVFAITASLAGTISIDEARRLQAYLIVYTAVAVLMTFVVLPLLVSCCTPFRYGDVIRVSKDAMLMAFATGKLLVVLPLLVDQTERLFERYRRTGEAGVAPAVDVLYPLVYPFPHLGKLLGMLFIPFAAWFLGRSLEWEAYPLFLAAGLLSHFGGPLLAMPFLLDLTHLPHDMFQLFLASGVYCGRLSDALGVMHLVTFTLITSSAFLGQLRLNAWALVRYLLVTTALGISLIVALRVGLQRSLPYLERKEDVIAQMQLLEHPVESRVLPQAEPNPAALQPGESLLARIRRRGALRVGFNADKLPFAYFNQRGELVGFDVAMAHALAQDLRVRLEFVPFDRETLIRQLNGDHFDVVMSGLVGTLERAEAMQHSSPYLDVTLALVVPDHRVGDFASLDQMQRIDGLRIGFVDLSREFADRVRAALPNAELVELPKSRSYFEEAGWDLDALLIIAESGSAFTLFYPEYEVVIPEQPRISLPLFYAIGARDSGLHDYLEHWILLRKQDGTLQQNYDRWILGKLPEPTQPRWSVIRNVLGWVD